MTEMLHLRRPMKNEKVKLGDKKCQNIQKVSNLFCPNYILFLFVYSGLFSSDLPLFGPLKKIKTDKICQALSI